MPSNLNKIKENGYKPVQKMNFSNEYKMKLKTADEAVQVVKSGDWVDYNTSNGMPIALDEALAKRKYELENVNVRGYLALHKIAVVEADPEQKAFTYNTWHCSGYERKLIDKGQAFFIPMTFRNLSSYYERYLDVDVAMLSVSPMDEHGYFSFSINAASAKSVIDKAKFVIVEVNENLPKVQGGFDEAVHISEVDYIVEGNNDPLVTLGSPAPTEIDNQVAKFVVESMVDESTIQIGIGGMPNAIGQMIAKSDLKNLGIHTELLVDAYLDMYKAGKITNAAKTIDKNKGIFGFALGSQELYDWVKDNPGMATAPISYVNAPSTIAKLDNFVSINNCISVDLYGQICAESAGTRHISGTGGQLDFLTGAYDSKGGKSFICMTSSYKDKEGNLKSRFLPGFNGDIVTDPRSQSFILVTEYGKANLAGLATWQRAEALISLANPVHREELIKAAEKQKIWRKANKR